MGYTNSRETMKWWDPHTKKLKYFSYAKFDEHNNRFRKGWYPSSALMTSTNVSALQTLKLISHITNLSNMTYLGNSKIFTKWY